MTSKYLSLLNQHREDLEGQAIASGIRLMELDLVEIYSFIWWYMTNGASQEDRTKFRNWLWMPPKGVVATSGPWSAESETSALQSFKMQVKG